MRDVQFGNGEYYHVYNRGVDKRILFFDQQDYRRFYEGLYLFNDANYRNTGGDAYYNATLLAASDVLHDQRKRLVDIVSFCLLPNHYHLLLCQRQTHGVSAFMQKLGIGYAQYFNHRYGRTGRLFEGPYNAKHVRAGAYLYHLPRYIHLNTLDLTDMNWREGLQSNWESAEQFLRGYPWSSHATFLGVQQELPVIVDDARDGVFESSEAYLNALKEWSLREVEQNKSLRYLISL